MMTDYSGVDAGFFNYTIETICNYSYPGEIICHTLVPGYVSEHIEEARENLVKEYTRLAATNPSKLAETAIHGAIYSQDLVFKVGIIAVASLAVNVGLGVKLLRNCLKP